MLVGRFLKVEDERLNENINLEIHTVDKNGETLTSKWHEGLSMNEAFILLQKKHLAGIQVSILDLGDELLATITANAKSVQHHYKITMSLL